MRWPLCAIIPEYGRRLKDLRIFSSGVVPYIYNASQKDSYICREIAREKKREKDREKAATCESGRRWKRWICEKKEERLMAKAIYFAGTKSGLSIFVLSDFYTYVRAYARRIGRTGAGWIPTAEWILNAAKYGSDISTRSITACFHEKWTSV